MEKLIKEIEKYCNDFFEFLKEKNYEYGEIETTETIHIHSDNFKWGICWDGIEYQTNPSRVGIYFCQNKNIKEIFDNFKKDAEKVKEYLNKKNEQEIKEEKERKINYLEKQLKQLKKLN